jgi:hypothetical protein
MDAKVGRRLVVLGTAWGLVLATVPALVMAQPGSTGGFLVAALLCAAVSGCVAALVAGRRVAARRNPPGASEGYARGSALLGSVGAGALLGLVGGVVAAVLFWALMTVTLSGLSLDNPVDVSTLMRPQVFLGSFFVALSVFLYVVAAGILVSPASGALVRWAVGAGEKA